MGSKQSSAVKLPLILKEHWQEMPLPASTRRKVSHGHYLLFINALTNQKIEQYSIVFQDIHQFQQYLESFAWREREENIVNTKYFENVKEEPYCGTRIYAKVYLEHIPYRLSSINDIPLPENIYILNAALAGFQKLYSLIGYFRPNEDMIGIDSEGRVKIWLNSNFSKNYLFGPHYVEGRVDYEASLKVNLEEKMVREVINIVEQNTSYEYCKLPRLSDYFEERKLKLTFNSAQREIAAYSRRFDIVVPKYFVSLVKMFRETSGRSNESLYQHTVSDSDSPFKISESKIQQNRSNIIYYIDPALDSSQGAISKEMNDRDGRILTRLEQSFVELPREGDTTEETFIKNSFKNSHTFSNSLKQRGEVPTIHFKYLSKDSMSTPSQDFLGSNSASCHQINTPQFHLPLSRIAENNCHESAGPTKRLTYSDKNKQHYLDEQIAEDMVKYLNS